MFSNSLAEGKLSLSSLPYPLRSSWGHQVLIPGSGIDYLQFHTATSTHTALRIYMGINVIFMLAETV
jgi:hypothetical protein